MCRICTGQDPETAKTNFYARILELGGKVLGEYVNSSTRILCVCSQGHECFVSPNSIQQGHGMCRICTGRDPETAKTNFYARILEQGGKVLGKYINTDTPVECICKNGHICKPRPHHLKRGIVLCVKCLLCPSCGLWRTRGFLCSYCKPYTHNKLFAKTKEMAVVRFLKDRLPDEEFIHNRSVGRDCTGGHLFPDIRFDRIFYNLIVEVDERKHSGSGYECDERRMYDIIAKIWTPCIFIRYNPDAKDSCREVLLKKVQEYLELDEEGDSYPWDEYGFKVEYLFY
jgi:hypothetical protein